MRRLGGLVVSASDFQPEGRWLKIWCLPSCCLLRQENLLHIVSLHPSVYMGTSDIMLGGGGGNLAMD